MMAIIYELLDEIIGGILPGVYFCTYFLLCALVLFGDSFILFFHNGKSVYLIGLPFLSVSYVLGTLFKRGNSELTDSKSVKYIIKKSKNNIENSEYMNTVSDQLLEDRIKTIEDFKQTHFIWISSSYLKNKKRMWQIEKKPNHRIFMYALKRIKHEYIIINAICFILNPFLKKCDESNRFIEKRSIIEKMYSTFLLDIDLKVDYPYTHLRDYLINNGMNDLAAFVTWDSKSGRRTKAFINDILSTLTENQYLGMKQVKKREAHIRFMNSAYHSQLYLFICSLIVFVSVFLLYLSRYIWLITMGYKIKSFSLEKDGPLVFTIQRFFNYTSRIVDYKSLFIIMCISAGYMLFFAVTRKLILGNYHYQRIHEIVYLLQAKKHVLERIKKTNNDLK